jgi:hypothetical protein
MEPKEFIAIAIIALIIGGALFFVIRSKKQGKKCIGCPYSDKCKSGSCSCSNDENNNS